MADNLDTPYSRREIFYKGILDQDPDSLPDPETREERYLKAIAEAYPTPVEATVTQDEGSSTTSVMSQKAVTDALDGLRDSKLDKTGTAPLADNLTPYSADSGATQTTPFIAQGTGCGNGESVVDTGSYAQIKKKLGNTVCVNQLVPDAIIHSTVTVESEVAANGWGPKIGDIPATFDGHYIYVWSKVSNGKCFIAWGSSARKIVDASANTTEQTVNSGIYLNSNADTSGTGAIYWRYIAGLPAGTYTAETYIIDLALWYGSNLNIPAHLLSHPEDFGKYCSGSLAANPGQLVNADGSVLTSIGRNMWDEEWELGSISATTGANSSSSNNIRSKNYNACIPNTAYCGYYHTSNLLNIFWYDRDKNFIRVSWGTGGNDTFVVTSPANAAYFRVRIDNTSTYNNNATVSHYYSGESGYDQHYPYTVLAQIDTGSETLYAYDEKAPDGTIYRNTLRVDLGTLAWVKGTYAFYTDGTGILAGSVKAISDKYVNVGTMSGADMPDKSMSPQLNGRLYVKDSEYEDADTFATAMSGHYIEVEAATPTTEQGTPFSGASADNFAIDDFGSMYWTQSAGVPQGVEIFYPYDYKAAVDTILNMVDGDVKKLVTETKLGAVADRIPEAPAEDGAYTLKATVADGVKTYAWVADE